MNQSNNLNYSEPPVLVTKRTLDQISASPNQIRRKQVSQVQTDLMQQRMANLNRPSGVDIDPSK
jgi:hypothetical protein